MSVPQFIVFHTESNLAAGIINKLTLAGLTPLVDSTHVTEDYYYWFPEQFSKLDHRVYYNAPGFLTGFIDDVDFGIMGIPHVILYFTTPGEKQISYELLGILDKWVNKIINDVDFLNEEENAKLLSFLKLPEKPSAILIPEKPAEDEFVKISEARNHYYTFECKHIPDFDKCIISICKPDYERPFTLIINDFKKVGYINLFTDIFASPDWGSILDVNFLHKLWKELRIEKEFNLEERLLKRTEEFLPNDECECPSEPQVYRMSIEDILKGSSYGRIFY